MERSKVSNVWRFISKVSDVLRKVRIDCSLNVSV